VALGAETVTGPLGQFDRAAARKRIVELSEQYKLDVDPDAKIESLPVGVRQRVEIIKALYRHSDILVLDEPSAVLTPHETAELYGIIRSLAAGGTTVIFITHKLNEVLEVADDIVVLRRGRVAGTADPKTATRQELANLMVGRDGLIAPMSIAENYILDSYYREPYSRRGVFDLAAVNQRAAQGVKDFDIRTPSIDTRAGSLSGGNQQKVVVAREFSVPVQLVIAAQPTRGLDVGSIEYIHRRLVERRDAGAAIVIVSTELDEVLAVGDRIAVMFGGRIVGIVSGADATYEKVGLLMGGGSSGEGAAA
jgi:ABC-type uncharacterized transport system ATPase subunit